MVALIVATCPRCGSRLGIESDADYGWCPNHGPQFIGVPLADPRVVREATPPDGFAKDADRRECIDCGASIAHDSKRCLPCAQKQRAASVCACGNEKSPNAWRCRAYSDHERKRPSSRKVAL